MHQYFYTIISTMKEEMPPELDISNEIISTSLL